VTGPRKVTIYDVAGRAGVSISTVSLAFNNPGRVKPETLGRIVAAAEALGFEPHAEAAGRARRTHRRIGVMAPFTSYPSFAHRLSGVLRVCAKNGVEVVVYDHPSAAVATPPLLASLPLTRQLDGLVIMGLPLTEEIAARLHRQRLGVVLVDVVRNDVNSVCVDDVGGGAMVARYLLDKGHRRFAFLGEEQASGLYRSPSQDRHDGFAAALHAGGIGDEDITRRLIPHQMDRARLATLELLAQPRPPTAVFAYDDVLACGALRAAHQQGLSVPGDLAVVGYDDLDLAEALGLTTVRLPFEESGAAAAEILAAHLEEPERTVRQVMLRLSIVERNTA